MSKVTTSSASVADTAELKERLLALEAMVAGLVTALSAPAAAPAAPAAPAANTGFRTYTSAEFQMLTPQQKAAYTLQCRAAVFGAGNDNLTGMYGAVTGFASNQIAKIQNSGTHAVDEYSRTRAAYLAQRAGL
jgi:hypothetical protein